MRQCLLTIVLAALVLVSPAAQTRQGPYHPLTSPEMVAAGTWSEYKALAATLTAAQLAEARRRHFVRCLEAIPMAPPQRAIVQDYLVTRLPRGVESDPNPNPSPVKRQHNMAAAEQSQRRTARARAVMGEDLYERVFGTGPTMAILQAVKDDPAIK